MTYRTRSGGRGALVVAVVAAALGLAGCAAASLDEIAPARDNRRPGTGPVDTGTYPNLNLPRDGAATPLTPEQTAAKLAELEGARRQQGAGNGPGISPAESARLQRLSAERQAAAAATN